MTSSPHLLCLCPISLGRKLLVTLCHLLRVLYTWLTGGFRSLCDTAEGLQALRELEKEYHTPDFTCPYCSAICISILS